MKPVLILVILVFASAAMAENLEKTQKKQLESEVKAMTAEAQSLERSGHLAEARIKYAESQALIEMQNVADALKHLDEEIHKKVKDALNDSRKLYDSHKFKEAAAALDEGMKLQAFQPVLAYNLALCYYQLGDRAKALEYMGNARAGAGDPKQKQRLLQLSTFFTTGESGLSLKDNDRDRIVRVNRLSESIGLEASLEDEEGAEEDAPAEANAASDPQPAQPSPSPAVAKTPAPAPLHSSITASHRSSLCNALAELKPTLGNSPAATFDLANCAESNGRTAEAVKLLEKYLEMAPEALDAADARARIVDLKALLGLPGQNGVEVRRLYASVYTALAERKYDRAQADLIKAGELAPEFPLTKWKLALLYEAMGDVDQAKSNFTRYTALVSEQTAKDEAALHLDTLTAKRTKYDEEVDEAEDIMADLFSRSMKLPYDGSDKRSALRMKRAGVKNKKEASKARNRIAGFAIPYAYAQQQLGRASEHLQIALALFPLGAEANQLMGQVFLQANDGHSATKNFDVVASENLPVAFYAEMRGRKQDEAVKCELTRDRVRLISLSAYDKRGNATPPSKPAGDDGLGDLVIDPTEPRQQGFDSLDLTLADIKKVETNGGILKLKLAQKELTLSPIYMPSFGEKIRQQLHPPVRPLPRTRRLQARNRRHERR